MRSRHYPIFLLAVSLLLTVGRAKGEDFEFFEKHVRPILVDHCYPCHSAEGGKIKGGLRLDSREGILKGGESGDAILAGDPDNSLLIKAVRYIDKDLQMPPKDKKLSDAQIRDLVSWVKMGAPDPRTSNTLNNATAETPTYDFAEARKQWAFRTPENPAVPQIRSSHWPRTPIDNFILAKLESRNLPPAPQADKRTLIRRATFDLIGLPPSPDEVDAFLKDNSPDAFATVVDRLLDSPHYGERWGRHWLDVVRYTDSLDSRVTGQESDILDSYRYRDWVVNAFNQDLPYDQFVREQIAGDLMQPRDPDGINTNAIIATGVYAIGNWGNGDADKDKILTDIADDQVDVTGRAFLGLTLSCARCHDHKFDPIPTADYYSMAGIFFSSHILAKLTPKGAGENVIRVPLLSKAELERRKQRDERILTLDKEIQTRKETELAGIARSMLPATKSYLMAAADFRNRANQLTGSTAADYLKGKTDAKDLNAALLQQWINYLGIGDFNLLSRPAKNLLDKPGLHAWRNAKNEDTPSAVANNTDAEIAFLSIKMPPRSLAIHPSPKSGVAIAWKSPITGTVSISGKVSDADPNCGDGIDWTIKLKGSKQISSGSIPNAGMQSLVEGQGADAMKVVQVQAGEMIELAVLPKGEYSCDTTLVELTISELTGKKRIWNIVKDTVPDFEMGANPHKDSYGNMSVWHIYDMAGQSAVGEIAKDSPFGKWLELTKQKAAKTDIEQAATEVQAALLATDVTKSITSNLHKELTDVRSPFWTGAPDTVLSKDVLEGIIKLQSELTTLRKNPPPPVPMTHALQEGGVPESPHAGVHDVKIHVRGRYDRLGEMAPRGFPRVLTGDDQKSIAEGSGRLQLADWITSPSNPLTARVMVNRIWQHHFSEGIVRTPNNFGKLGTPPTHPELLDYLAHRFIDSGWSVKSMHRAIMLSATYQQSSVPDSATLKADPDNLLFGRMNRRRLESEAIRDSLLAASGRLDLTLGGPAIRDFNTTRRTLYVMTIRSDRATYQFLFDAADPNAIVEKRIDSTVAPQSLFLLNHPFALAQTKALAERLTKEVAGEDNKKIEWLYKKLYARLPSPTETNIGLTALAQSRKTSSEVKSENSDAVAWREYCQVLVCANEFVYLD